MKKLFALLALAAAMLACTPEQVETAFKLAGGKVLVEVEVVDIINGGAYSGPVEIHFTRGGLDITNEFQTIVGSGTTLLLLFFLRSWPAVRLLSRSLSLSVSRSTAGQLSLTTTVIRKIWIRRSPIW